jgi:hypothetical protein
MKGKYHLKKILVIGAILLMIIPVLPVGLSTNSDFKQKQTDFTSGTEYFENSIVLIIGKCNVVQGPLLWIFGLYIPILKKSFLVRASGGEGEQLNVMIRGNEFATFIDYENILVEFNGVKGILFWGQKSIITNSSRIFIRCKADNIFVTTYD